MFTPHAVAPTDRPEFYDLNLTCSVCSGSFVFTADEQLFFFEKGFQHAPKRCKRCMANRAARKCKVRAETHTQCACCGAPTTVPFIPSQRRPVLCHACFQSNKAAAAPPALVA
ncbi:MAG: zinc-ribbon domain containing protein [Terracidiphilus sp.]|jgi:CxxC-x17-CxxC domain-containing protein